MLPADEDANCFSSTYSTHISDIKTGWKSEDDTASKKSKSAKIRNRSGVDTIKYHT